MLKVLILTACLVNANAYLNHGPASVIPPNYGHYGSHGNYENYENYGHAAPVAPAVVPAAHSYNHGTEVAPYVHTKSITATPTVNPYLTASRHAINANYHQSGYAHSGYSGYSHASTAPYVPPPVIVPPTVTYNQNVIPPSVHNVNHAPAPNNYPHQAHAANYHYHARYAVPYSPVYAHGPMYQKPVNVHGW